MRGLVDALAQIDALTQVDADVVVEEDVGRRCGDKFAIYCHPRRQLPAPLPLARPARSDSAQRSEREGGGDRLFSFFTVRSLGSYQGALTKRPSHHLWLR